MTCPCLMQFGQLHTRAKTTKGWPRLTKKQRLALLRRCGRSAFLDPDNLKYPVKGRGCEYDCRGLRVAKQRASMHKKSLVKKADALAKRAGCRWSGKKSKVTRRRRENSTPWWYGDLTPSQKASWNRLSDRRKAEWILMERSIRQGY